MADRGRNTDEEHRFADWVREHGRVVRGFLLASVRRIDVADELSQEVFCRAWQARASYREQGAARAYLLRIADRLVCDRSRRNGTHVNLDHDGWEQHEPVCAAADPPAAAMRAEENRELGGGLGSVVAAATPRVVAAVLRPIHVRRDRRNDRLPAEHDLESRPPRTGGAASIVGGEEIMNNDLETSLRSLDQATAAGDKPSERLDPETASLREAWLAFGEMLEAAQPPSFASPLPTNLRSVPGEGPGVRAAFSRRRRHWPRLLAAGLLAASLLIAVAAIWTTSAASRRDNPDGTRQQTVSNNRRAAPLQKSRAKSVSTADAPQWDDSLDEQFEQVGWQMLCVQENQAFRTDAFGQAQYRLEQFREAVQADSL